MQEILLFLISSLALTLMPGPDILFVINQSVVNKKHGIITSLGLCSGLVFHTMFLVFGVSTIIQLNNDFIIYLKYFGAIYVLYLGFTELKSNIKSNENIDSKIYLRGLIASFGFKQKGIEYDREKRKKGSSNFKLADLFGLAFDGILNHSMLPLRLASIVGILISLITIFGSLGYLIIKVYYPNTWPPGFATTTILILISISLNGLFLGIIGEYIGRIYNILKKRPNVIIDKKLNI